MLFRSELTVMGEPIKISSPLNGVHQQRNVAVAIATAVELSNHHGYKLSAGQIAEGVRSTRWPGRLERFSRPGQPGNVGDHVHVRRAAHPDASHRASIPAARLVEQNVLR